MGKSSRKQHDPVRAMAVKAIAAQYGCTESHVRSMINGVFTGGNADEIRRAYNAKYSQLKQVLTS